MSITARLVSTRSVSILELNHTTSHWVVARGFSEFFPQKNTSSHCCVYHCRIPAGFQRFFSPKTPLRIVAYITGGFQLDLYQGMKGFAVHVTMMTNSSSDDFRDSSEEPEGSTNFGDPARILSQTRVLHTRNQTAGPPRASPRATARRARSRPRRRASPLAPPRAEPGAGSRADRRARRLARQ